MPTEPGDVVIRPVGTILEDGTELTQERHDEIVSIFRSRGITVLTTTEYEERLAEDRRMQLERERLKGEMLKATTEALQREAGGKPNRAHRRHRTRKGSSRKNWSGK